MNEFWPIATGRSEDRLQPAVIAATPPKPPIASRSARPSARPTKVRTSRQRPTPCVAVFEAVPVRRLFLAELPAEEELAAAMEAREVDEPAVEILYEHAKALELVHCGHELAGGALDLRRRLRHIRGRQSPAVRRDARDELRLLPLRAQERRAHLDHPLGERAHDLERIVRLLRRKKALGHASMTPRRGRRSTGASSPAPRFRRATAREGRESGPGDLRVVARRDLGGRALRLADVRAEPPPAGAALGRALAPRLRLGRRRLGALGQQVADRDRRARLHLGARVRLLPALPRGGRSLRPRLLRPLRDRRRARLPRRRVRVVPPAPAHRRRAARPRRQPPRGPLPGALPDEPLPAGGLHGVALPAADARSVPARRTRPLPRGRRCSRARPPYARGGHRAPAGARADCLALAQPAPRLPRARRGAAPFQRVSALPLARTRRPIRVPPRRARPQLDA